MPAVGDTEVKRAVNCLIMGAAGRDFHNFLVCLKDHPGYRVRAFTATQIPFIDRRSFPAELAGERYPDDISIVDEGRIAELIEQLQIDMVFFSYSDISHEELMHKASGVLAAGASFTLLGPRQTQLEARVPVIGVTATRTGAGKSPLTQFLARGLRDRGFRVAVIRHPMPYGNLQAQRTQCFSTVEDLAAGACTIEEREEYEPYVEMGIPIHAGMDYAAVLREAEEGADLVLWDGGNNDFPFVRPDLDIVVADPLRAGHETAYYPGEVNFRAADLLVLSKSGSARPEQLDALRRQAAALNPAAEVIVADLAIELASDLDLDGRSVLVVEDGPTVTHGGMPHGAGTVAARRAGARPIDPRPYAVGSIREVFAANAHLDLVLPAMGYSEQQRAELKATIEAAFAAERPAAVVDACPGRLELAIELAVPVARVSYRFEQREGPSILDLAESAVRRQSGA